MSEYEDDEDVSLGEMDIYPQKPNLDDLEEFELKDVEEIAAEAKEKSNANTSKFYDDENLGDDFESTPWLAPSIAKAVDHRSDNMFRRGNAALSTVKVCQAPDLGVGVAMFFQFIRSMGICLFVMSVLSLPTMYFGYIGSAMPQQSRDGMNLYRVSLGNIGYDPESPTYKTDSFCNKYRNSDGTIGADDDDTSIVIGNFTSSNSTSGYNSTTLDTCITLPWTGGYQLTLSEVGSILTLMEVLQVFAFFCMVYHLHRKLQSLGQELDRQSTSLTDYAIMIRKIPKDTTAAELIKHFSELYPLNKPDWANRPPLAGARPVQECSNTLNKIHLGTWVAECTIFPRIGKLLDAFKERQHLTVGLRRARAEMKMYAPNTTHANGPNLRRYAIAEKKVYRLGAEIDRLAEKTMKLKNQPSKSKTKGADKKASYVVPDNDEESVMDKEETDQQKRERKGIGKLDADVVSAMIVFEYNESMARCLEDQEKYSSFPYIFFRPKQLKFKGQFLSIVHAPEPDQIGWEYLEVPTFIKYRNRVLTAVVAIITLLICFGVIVQGSIYKTKFEQKIPNLSVCKADVPQTFGYQFNMSKPREYSQYSLTRPNALLRPYYDNQCDDIVAGSFYVVLAKSIDSFTTTMVPYNFSSCIQSSNFGNGGLCPHTQNQANDAYCPCVSLSATETCATYGCVTNKGKLCNKFDASVVASCYCFEALTNMIQNQGVSATVNYIKSSKSDACYPFFENYSTATSLTYAVTIVTVLVNYILKIVLIKLTKYEKHSRVDQRQASLMMKLFLSTYFNIALVVLIAYGYLRNMPVSLRVAQIFQGQYFDFTREWYGTVGAYLVLTFAIQVISLPVGDLVSYLIINPLRRCLLYAHISSQSSYRVAMQDDLNKMEVDAELDVVTLTSQMLALIFFAMTYAAGLPALILLSFLAFLAYFSIFKRLLCRYYRKPIKIDSAIVQTVTTFLPYAAIIRMAFSSWILSNNDILPATFPDFGLSTGSTVKQVGNQSVGSSSYLKFLVSLRGYAESNGELLLKIQKRLLQPNIFPLIAVLVLIVVGKLVVKLWPYLPISWCLRVLRMGYIQLFRKKKKVYVDENGVAFVELNGYDILKDEQPYRQEMAPYTGDYFKYIHDKDDIPSAWCSILSVCCTTAEAGLVPLTEEEIIQGWIQVDQGKYVIKSKVWKDTTLIRGVTRIKGDYKKTYEVVLDSGGGNSYHLSHIPAYKMAYAGITEGALSITDYQASKKMKRQDEERRQHENAPQQDWKKPLPTKKKPNQKVVSEDDEEDHDEEEDEDSDDDDDEEEEESDEEEEED